MSDMLLTLLAVVVALLLDRWLGEPKKYHPLVGFGRLATAVEKSARAMNVSFFSDRVRGGLAWLLVVALPVILLGWLIHWLPNLLGGLVAVLTLYLAIGLRSLQQHAEQVAEPIEAGDLATAREAVSRIVSRDTQQLDQHQVSAAAVESVLENGSDAVFAPVFWFLVAGAPGVLAYRLINTLDAMWGYRNERYQGFGFIAAKVDDLMNWVPARLTALSYCLTGDFNGGWRAMREQGPQTDSPNAGRVMAAGAGALSLQLGGPTSHNGEPQWRPRLGHGRTAEFGDIGRAVNLLQRSVVLWLVLGLMIGIAG